MRDPLADDNASSMLRSMQKVDLSLPHEAIHIYKPYFLSAGHETGEDSVQVYREVAAPAGIGFVYKSVHPTHAEAGPLDGQAVLTPYPPLERLQQKRLAARRHKTTFCYDFPSVFQNALREAWTDRAVAGEPGEAPRGELS